MSLPLAAILRRTANLGAVAVLGLIGVVLFPAGSQAETSQDRCLILGPLAVSGYIGFLEQVAQESREAAARQSQNAADIISLYERLGCPQGALIEAIECLSSHVVAPTAQKPIAAVAEHCMEQAGMPTR